MVVKKNLAHENYFKKFKNAKLNLSKKTLNRKSIIKFLLINCGQQN